MTSSQRNSLIVMGVAGASAYAFYRADNFWGLVLMCLTVVWAMVTALPIMDSSWRIKVGFTLAIFLGSVVALLPTLSDMSRDKSGKERFHCPEYIRERITFGVVK